ncbi:MAG: lipoate--protein ligase family protein [Acidimicrobiales bacterium]
MTGWVVERFAGSAAAFHGRAIPEPAQPEVWVFDVDRPALVLGSAQPPSDVDGGRVAAAGIDVVRRRSGGGAVLLVPGEVLWIDLVIPREDPRWSEDVGRAFHWVGDAWAGALASLGLTPQVHRDRLVASPWSPLVCFAGVGPGEVVVDGRKVVGLAQRRTRAGARFQCAVHRRFDATAIVELLAIDRTARAAAAAELAATVTGLDLPLDDLETAFLATLP